MIRFSVVTICFNSEKTIERTIKSVMSQSFKDFEYIIVDGKSTDSTLEIVKKYEEKFRSKLKWISEPDTGIYDAMNKGIKLSIGKFICIVNSDDWLESDALEKINQVIINNNNNEKTNYCAGINYHWGNNVKYLGVDINKFLKRSAPMYIMAGLRHPGIIVPKTVYKTIGLFDDKMRLSADQDFVLRCYYGGVSFVGIDFAISNMAEGGISTTNSNESYIYSVNDRKRMLLKFKKSGLEYYWLFYSWSLRCKIKQLLIYLKLYKVS